MKENKEFEGKNVQSAVQKACEDLQISTENLRYEVISHGSSGIFGLVGTRNARIRVQLPVQKTVQKEEPAFRESVESSVFSAEIVDGQPISEPVKIEPCVDSAELGREIVARIIDAMTSDTTISVAKDDGRLRYDIDGGNPGVMIGRRGQTLEAIHYIVEKIVNKNSPKRIRVHIDVGGYLEKRKQELQQLAARMAKKARKTGRPATIGQMSAHDRRIIHLALKDDVGVRTQSVGKGHIRNLIIFPRRPQGERRNKSDRSLPEESGAA